MCLSQGRMGAARSDIRAQNSPDGERDQEYHIRVIPRPQAEGSLLTGKDPSLRSG